MTVHNLTKVEEIKDEFISILYPNTALLSTLIMDLVACARRVGYLEASRDRLNYETASEAYNKYQKNIDEYWKCYYIMLKRVQNKEYYDNSELKNNQ